MGCKADGTSIDGNVARNPQKNRQEIVYSGMSLTQLFHLIESLPPALQVRVEVFVKSLREAQSSEANSGQPQPTIRWAADPNPAALLGLTKDRPLHIRAVRRKAWQR